MDHLDLAPIRRVRGTVKLPGSKSISNRILLLAALAQGETRIRDLLESDDTQVMLGALRALGIACADEGDRTVRVRGAGGPFPVKRAELFLGNAGTAYRPLTEPHVGAPGVTLAGEPQPCFSVERRASNARPIWRLCLDLRPGEHPICSFAIEIYT